ncbi:hypothetical protein JB92DRAFT_2859358 [Gautieria morchelliformis]|nr:hypothetical protein JB92DRAFT_2859358 [Gautieria morchelliformis]
MIDRGLCFFLDKDKTRYCSMFCFDRIPLPHRPAIPYRPPLSPYAFLPSLPQAPFSIHSTPGVCTPGPPLFLQPFCVTPPCPPRNNSAAYANSHRISRPFTNMGSRSPPVSATVPNVRWRRMGNSIVNDTPGHPSHSVLMGPRCHVRGITLHPRRLTQMNSQGGIT